MIKKRLVTDKTSPTYNTGVASEYYVLSLLYRLGYDAYLTLGNKKSIDIQIIQDGKSITIDVKSVQGYSSLIVNNVVSKSNHFIVFVVYNNKFNDVSTSPEVYVVPSSIVVEIAESFKEQKRIFKNKITPYLNGWDILDLYPL
jgi:hypothetical protein